MRSSRESEWGKKGRSHARASGAGLDSWPRLEMEKSRRRPNQALGQHRDLGECQPRFLSLGQKFHLNSSRNKDNVLVPGT